MSLHIKVDGLVAKRTFYMGVKVCGPKDGSQSQKYFIAFI